MPLGQLRRCRNSVDPRVLLTFCIKSSYVQIDGHKVQLTDHGLDYYLQALKTLP